MDPIFEYDIWSIVLSLAYSAIGLLLISLLLSKRAGIRKNDFTATVLSFGLLMSFFLVNHIFQLKSLPPDSSFYADIVRDFWKHYDSWSPGVRLYALINFIPIQLSMSYPSVLVVIHIIFYLMGIVLIGKAVALYSLHSEIKLPKDFYGQFLLIAAVYPAALIVIPSLLREGSMFFFFGLSTYLLIRVRFFKDRFRRLCLVLFIVTLFLLTLIRPIGGVSYILAMLTLYFIDQWRTNKLKAISKTVIPAAIGLWLINRIADAFYNMRFSPNWLGRYRASHKELFGTEAYGTELPWEGWLNILESTGLLFFQYTFAPLPLIIDPQMMIEKTIPLTDALFLIICLVPLIYSLKERAYRRIFIFAFVLLLVSALFETHVSGSYRHRMNGIVLLLPLVVIGSNKLLVQLSRLSMKYFPDERSKNEI